VVDGEGENKKTVVIDQGSGVRQGGDVSRKDAKHAKGRIRKQGGGDLRERGLAGRIWWTGRGGQTAPSQEEYEKHYKNSLLCDGGVSPPSQSQDGAKMGGKAKERRFLRNEIDSP